MPSEQGAPPASAQGRPTRVLVIDDEEDLGFTVEQTLAPEHEVVFLTDARQALRHIDADEFFDAILCDLRMPTMSGFEFHRRLSVSHPDLARRVVFLTGGTNPGERQHLAAIRNPCLEKPFSIKRLRELVARMVGSRADATAVQEGRHESNA